MNTEKNTAPAPVVNTLAGVLAIFNTPVNCRFTLDGQPVELKVTRALPGVMEQRRNLLRSVQPPFVKERNDYDRLNVDYMRRADAATLQARAITVYQCCPEVAALKPGLMDPAQILAALAAVLPEMIMELIELTAIAGGLDMEVTRRANFISPPPSES